MVIKTAKLAPLGTLTRRSQEKRRQSLRESKKKKYWKYGI